MKIRWLMGLWGCGVLVVFVLLIQSYEQRILIQQLQSERTRTRQLAVRYEQLLLEQAALSAHPRIERIAKEQLHMSYPELYEQKRLILDSSLHPQIAPIHR